LNSEILLRIAIGDAIALATEYVSDDPDLIRDALLFKGYLAHPKYPLKPGAYSDDTQMSISVAEVLLGDDWSKAAFADSFVRCFHRDPRKGYSRGFQKVLEGVRSGAGLIAALKPHSDKNGAAMRSVPVGFLSDPAQILRVSEEHAKITHDTRDGILSAQTVALMAHFAIHTSEPFYNLPYFLYKHLHPEWVGEILDPVWPPVVGPRVGFKTVQAVWNIIKDEPDTLDALWQIIAWGGDTDSVAAITLGILAPRAKDTLPPWSIEGLETNGAFGPEFLTRLNDRLVEKFLTKGV
jgi:ADP-ribosylglycohydrolase